MTPDITKVAIIQASPVYGDLPASLAKAVDLIRQAAAGGAKLITFGETWLPGYPAWLDYCPGAALWNHAPTKAVFARLVDNSLTIPGHETTLLSQLAQDLGVVLCLSVQEKTLTGTLYNTLLTINAAGKIINRHRKLMPTYTERLVWGQGEGEGLAAVDSEVGKIGGLICWEHWMPLARQAMHDSGEAIHVAVWPSVHEMHQVASRHYAFEGRCFVLAAGSLMRTDELPPELERPADLPADKLILRGGSAIIAPDGRYLAGPVYDEETILTADLDPTEITREKMTLDVSGHYARPDVFEFRLRG
jgi:predicted amidohydrolase